MESVPRFRCCLLLYPLDRLSPLPVRVCRPQEGSITAGKPLRLPSQIFRPTVNAQAHIELGFTRMATTLPAGAAEPPVLDNPNRRVARLLRYLLSYLGQFLPAVLLMALVGLLDAFRLLLIGPIFDRVLNPASQNRPIQLFSLPGTDRGLSLQELVPSHFHNPWTVVAFAFVGATVLKGIFDYVGTYLVNYAGFGMVTDLRDDLYNT